MQRMYSIVAPTRRDVFIRLNREVLQMRLKKSLRQILPYGAEFGVELGVVVVVLIMFKYEPWSNAFKGGDMLRDILLIIVIMAFAYPLSALVRIGVLWLKTNRLIRNEAERDLSGYDFTLTFDDEWINITTSGTITAIRWERLNGCRVLPNTIHLWSGHEHWGMFAREYLGDDAFAAMAAIAHEKIPRRTG